MGDSLSYLDNFLPGGRDIVSVVCSIVLLKGFEPFM